MNKELIIKAFNKAIQAYAKAGGHICQTDIVVDFNLDRMYVATLLDRHPGSLELPVKLKVGTGIMFLSYRPIACKIVPRIAWEEDDELHTMYSLFGYNGEGYLEARECKEELRTLIGDFLTKYPFNTFK